MLGRFAAPAARNCSVTQVTFIKPSWAPRPGDMVMTKTDKIPDHRGNAEQELVWEGSSCKKGQGGLDELGLIRGPEPGAVQGGQGCPFGMSEF